MVLCSQRSSLAAHQRCKVRQLIEEPMFPKGLPTLQV